MNSPAALTPQRRSVLLLASVFIVAVCGLIYELIAGALSSYLIGSSVTEFSLVIGLFMFAMGVGSFLSRFVRDNPLSVFVWTELAVGLVGGTSALVLFYAFTFLETYRIYMVLSTLAVGTLVGLEIPLVIRVLKEHQALSRALSSVLALDYVGALAASLLFPLVLLPYLGLVRSGFLAGLVNVAVAWLALIMLRAELRSWRWLRLSAVLVSLWLIGGLVTAGGLTRMAEDHLYQDEIILARDTPYQRIVVTRWHDDIRLYLNGHLQFSSVDEARYHEALVHPAMLRSPAPRRILILGGGDGLAAREVLKYPTVETIDLVDLDPAVTELFRQRPMLRELNGDSLNRSEVRIHNEDAIRFLERSHERWDVALVDLPDPSSPALARLYARSFYRLLDQRLTDHGVFAAQATSPFYAPEAFWCVVRTVQDALPEAEVLPYRVNVPSFGEWGFALAVKGGPAEAERAGGTRDAAWPALEVATRFLSQDVLRGMFVFPNDMQPRTVEVNRLETPVVVRYYERGWRRFNSL